MPSAAYQSIWLILTTAVRICISQTRKLRHREVGNTSLFPPGLYCQLSAEPGLEARCVDSYSSAHSLMFGSFLAEEWRQSPVWGEWRCRCRKPQTPKGHSGPFLFNCLPGRSPICPQAGSSKQGLCQVLGTRLGDRALELELFTALSSYITLDK